MLCHNDNIDSGVLLHAMAYARIWCLVAPISVLGSVAELVDLAILDMRTPFLAVSLTKVFNVVFDVEFCVHPFWWGVSGAAVATADDNSCGIFYVGTDWEEDWEVEEGEWRVK